MRKESLLKLSLVLMALGGFGACDSTDTPSRDSGPPGCVQCSPAPNLKRFLYVSLQNSGEIAGYRVDPFGSGIVAPIEGAPYSSAPGTYGLAVHPNGKFLYAANYDDRANVITAYSIDPKTGALNRFGRFRAGRGPAEIMIHPSGRFLYVSNWRGSGNVSGYQIDSESGALTEIPGSPFAAGMGPLGLAFDSEGRFLFVANTKSDSVSVFSVQLTSGGLVPVTGSPFPGNGLNNPEGLFVAPGGSHLVVSNRNEKNITLSVFKIAQGRGLLAPAGKSPYLFEGRCKGGCGLVSLAGSPSRFLVLAGDEGILYPALLNDDGTPSVGSGNSVALPGTSDLNDVYFAENNLGYAVSSDGNTLSELWMDSTDPEAGYRAAVAARIPSRFRIDAGKLALTPLYSQ